jgi:hypothetical protein
MNEIIFLYITINLMIIGFYKIFQIKWPELYFAINDQASYFVSISPLRYLLFRLMPPFFITAVLVGNLNNNLNESQIALFSSVTCLSHALFTNGRAVYNLLFDPEKVKTYFNRYFQFLIHSTTFMAIGSVGYFAGYLASKNFFLLITPTLPGLVDNLWASIIITFTAIPIYDAYSKRGDENVDKMLKDSHQKISANLTKYLHEQSEKYNANERLVLAVCIVENLQRPLWVRSIEKVKSIFNRSGSYGIMQTNSDHYITDEESIKKAIERYFANSKNEYMDIDTIEKWVKKYNGGSTYAELVKAAYNYLPGEDYEEALPG